MQKNSFGIQVFIDPAVTNLRHCVLTDMTRVILYNAI